MSHVCEWCQVEVPVTWWVRDGEADDANEVRVCKACRADYLYCLSGGRIAQNPEDQS